MIQRHEAVLIGKKFYSFNRVSSTNTIAYQLAAEGEPEGAVVKAEVQTHGRGKGRRRWSSPEGRGILISIILRPEVPAEAGTRLAQVVAIAVGRAIHRVTGLRSSFKWPNDLLINKKKVCGILCEMSTKSGKMEFAVVGIGVNVNATGKDLFKGATSLKNELGKTIQRPRLIREILKALEDEYLLFKKKCL